MAYYDRYRGSRRARRNRIKIILLILLLLVVVGIAVLFFLQDAAVFTADGFRFPFWEQEKQPQESQPPQNAGDIQLEIEDPQPGQTVPEESGPQPSDPETAPEPTAALLLDGSALLTHTSGALQQFQDSGFAQLALQVKTPDGLSLVDDGGVRDGLSPDTESFLSVLEGVDVPRIAVISALRDNVRPRTAHRSSALHTASGATWLDREYTAWFDPAGRDTLSCLIAVVDACRAAGFEQVVLQNFHYPTAGKLELIDYDDGHTRQSALTGLARQLREATDMPLGLVLTGDAAASLLDNTSGEDVAELARYFDILYVPVGGFDTDVSAVEEAVADTGCRVGLYVTGGGKAPAEFRQDYIQIP